MQIGLGCLKDVYERILTRFMDAKKKFRNKPRDVLDRTIAVNITEHN